MTSAVNFSDYSLSDGKSFTSPNKVVVENAIKPPARWYVSSVNIFCKLRWFYSALHQDEPLKEWTWDCRDEYLDELIRLEGHGQYTANYCPSCNHHSQLVFSNDAVDLQLNHVTVHCGDCFGGRLVCIECCVRNHEQNPLHVIEV